MRRTINFILICGWAFTASAREEYKRDFHKTAALSPGRAFRIESQLGRISIRTHARAEVDIRAVVRCSAETAREARSCAEQSIQVTVDESGSGVSVRTEYPRHTFNQHLSYGVDYDITMPESSGLDLRSHFGSVDVSNLHAPATIVSGNGNITFLGGRGAQRIENTFGNVEVRSNDGQVTINNGNGDVIAADITGALDISNRFGKVRVTNAGGQLTIHSNNVGIEASNVRGAITISNTFGRVMLSDAHADVAVENQNGEITANGVAGTAGLHTTFAPINFSRIGKALTVRAQNCQVRGDTVGDSATVETTFGGVDIHDIKRGARVTAANSAITLTRVDGEIYAKTTFAPIGIRDAAGPITVEGQNSSVTVDARGGGRCQPVSLRTSFGPIRVTIPSGAGYNVIARTSFGRIHTDPAVAVSVSGDIGQDGLTGKIGAGGCDLRLMDQNGNIDILR